MILRIKKRREQLGMSQEILAATLGVDQTSISQWERGVANPAVSRLPALAKALDCTIDDLFPKLEIRISEKK